MSEDECQKTVNDFAEKVIDIYRQKFKKDHIWSIVFIESAILAIQLVIDNQVPFISGQGYSSEQFTNPKIQFFKDVKSFLELKAKEYHGE